MNQPLSASFATPDDLPPQQMNSLHDEIQSGKEKSSPDDTRSAN